MKSVTSFTPGAAQAAASASSLSAQELTFPRKVTLPPSACTLICCASNIAFRLSAASICALTSVGATFGLTVIALATPFTPVRYCDCPLGGRPLEFPVNLAFQSQEAFLHRHLNPILGY